MKKGMKPEVQQAMYWCKAGIRVDHDGPPARFILLRKLSVWTCNVFVPPEHVCLRAEIGRLYQLTPCDIFNIYVN